MNKRMLIAVTVAGLAALAPQFARGQAAEVKTAEQVYKNITHLKGTPADQLTASMQFISASLGVDCEFCHVQGKPEADDKRPKATTREMIAMTETINKECFRGSPAITCYSCHRGAQRPVSSPLVQDSDTPPARPASMAVARPAGATAPTVDQVIEKYVAAAGGADNLKKINSRVMKGVVQVGGNETPIELFTKAPNKRVSVSHMGNNDSYTAFDGTNGWTGNATNQRDMAPAEAASA